MGDWEQLVEDEDFRLLLTVVFYVWLVGNRKRGLRTHMQFYTLFTGYEGYAKYIFSFNIFFAC